LLDQSGMAVLSNDPRPNERGQLGGRAARRVVPGTLQDRGAFPGDGVLPDLPDSYRGAIRRAVRVGVRHANDPEKILNYQTIPNFGLFLGSWPATCAPRSTNSLMLRDGVLSGNTDDACTTDQLH
jgi:hypothetical protein